MREEELFEALAELDPKSVEDARFHKKQKRPVWVRWAATAACAAILAGILFGVRAVLDSGRFGAGARYPAGVKTVLAIYPKPVASTMSAQKFMESDAHWNWWNAYRIPMAGSEALQTDMTAYYAAVMAQLLPAEKENTVCSPLNTYIAFSMLAEASDGNTRQQLLDLLAVSDIGTLRENISALWESNYVDTPALKSVLANSLWLNGSVDYERSTLDTLAERYHASTFSGTPGSKEMDQALRTWTDTNTGGLLTEYTKTMSITPDTVLEILSTIYYKAMWQTEFQESATTRETFHGTTGDAVVDMMHRTDSTTVYRAEHFTAVSLGLTDSGSMYFLLPDKDTEVNALASDPDLLRVIRYDGENENWSSAIVHLSVPRFRVSGKVDLLGAIRALGVSDALDPAAADFAPLTTARDDLYLSQAEHAAMLEIDEHGVIGAAYTQIGLSTGSMIPDEEINLVLDRPFLFLVTGRDGSVLFAGIVRNIG